MFGSVAKGNDTVKSDIDLMVIGEDLGYPELYAELQKAEHVLHRQVNPIFLSVQGWRDKLARKNSFIGKISTQPKIFILGSEHDLQP